LAQPTRIKWPSLLTIVSVMILIGTEVLGVALSAGWALAGLLELGDTVGHILMGLFTLLGAYVLVILWRHAVSVEPITER
jgi:hypothetical protein